MDLGDIFGAMYLGMVTASILFGITNLQVYLYYRYHSSDSRMDKIFVAVLWILDSVHTALVIHVVYYYLIELGGSSVPAARTVWSLRLQGVIHILTMIFVRTLYVSRVWRLWNSRIVPCIVFIAAIIGAGIGTVAIVSACKVQNFAQFEEMTWAIYSMLTMSVANNVAIAIAMCFYLRRNMVGFSGTNSKIIVIMRYVLASGLITSVCSLTALVTYATMPKGFVFLGVIFFLPKVYINGFLALLNSRQRSHNVTSTTPSSIPGVTSLRNITLRAVGSDYTISSLPGCVSGNKVESTTSGDD